MAKTSRQHTHTNTPTAATQTASKAGSDFVAHRHHNIVRIVIWVAILIVLFFVCMGIGRATISPIDVAGILANSFFGIGDAGSYSQTDIDIIINVRLPIVVAAILCGAALATSGATYQGLFRNPLVSPDLLGASAGAAFGAALGLLWELPNIMVQLLAFIGGFIAVLITYFSAKYLSRGVNQILLLVLAGMIIQTLFKSFLSAIKYIADPYSTLPAITYWLMGSLAKVTWESIAMFMVPFLIGIIPILIFRWRINTLSLGDDEAKSLGMNVGVLRGMFIFCSTLLTSAVVAIAGIVGWVGLIIPHLVRFVFGEDNRIVIPMSLVIGACFLIVVNTACNSLIASEIPLGILTSIVGAPFFFIILLKQRKGGSI